MDKGEKWLSILIPLFNHSEGLIAILNAVEKNIIPGVEVLVGDDSNNPSIAASIMKSHPLSNKAALVHIVNQEGKGGCKNWNALLKTANGKLIWMIHHDEIPRGENILRKIKASFDNNATLGLIIAPVNLTDMRGRKKRFVPIWFQRVLIKHLREYILLRNFIGPVSAIVVRNDISILFDCKLMWLIDVDWFYRLFRDHTHCFVNFVEVDSDTARKDSITASLRSSVKKLSIKERDYFAEKYRDRKKVAVLLRVNRMCLFKMLDSIIWTGLTRIYRLSNHFSRLFQK